VILNGFQVAVAQLGQRQLALRAINLALLVFKACKLASCNRGVGCLQTALDFLAVRLDARIVDAVG
jgi:hypothetical protein